MPRCRACRIPPWTAGRWSSREQLTSKWMLHTGSNREWIFKSWDVSTLSVYQGAWVRRRQTLAKICQIPKENKRAHGSSHQTAVQQRYQPKMLIFWGWNNFFSHRQSESNSLDNHGDSRATLGKWSWVPRTFFCPLYLSRTTALLPWSSGSRPPSGSSVTTDQ